MILIVMRQKYGGNTPQSLTVISDQEMSFCGMQEYMKKSPAQLDKALPKVRAFHRLFLSSTTINKSDAKWKNFRDAATKSV